MQTTSIALTSYTKILRQKDHEIMCLAEYEPVSQSTCTPVHLISVSVLISFSFFVCKCMLFILVEYFKTSKFDSLLGVDQDFSLYLASLFFFFCSHSPWRESGIILSVTLATQCTSFRISAKCSLVYIMPHWCKSKKRYAELTHTHTHTHTDIHILRRPESCARRSLIHQT